MEALQRASTPAIMHLKRTCIEGGFDGRRFDSCFYGTLAKGDGISFVGLTQDEVFVATRDHAKTLGVELTAHCSRTPAELHCLNVYHTETAETNSALADIGRWCDEEIDSRLALAEFGDLMGASFKSGGRLVPA